MCGDLRVFQSCHATSSLEEVRLHITSRALRPTRNGTCLPPRFLGKERLEFSCFIRKMAEARAVPSLGGYDEEFVNAVEEDLHCAICQLPLKEAVQTGNCGHRFCRKCLDEHFRRLEIDRQPFQCPVDRNNIIPDKDIFPDKATERKILSFIIKCPSEGCQWTGELRSKESHLAACPLKVVSCTNENCHVNLIRNKLQEHVITTCPWRSLCCYHCSVSHPACKTEVHQSECMRLPLNCPQNCGAVIPREEVSSHIEKDCPLTIISCMYAQMGCTTKVQRKEVESHLQAAMRLHLDLACVTLNNMHVQLSNTQVQLNDTREEFKESTIKLEEKVNVLEKKIQCSDEHNNYKWKISGFGEVLRKAKSGEKTFIVSSPFYQHGYKCKLRLSPNGRGYYENTHLSVFLIIIKGEHDATLPWPFHKMVTFTLIDQRENTNDRENIVVSCTTDPGRECYVRPVTDKNTGRGPENFVSHEKLRERCYIMDDTIFIQIQLSPPQLFA